MKERNLDFDRVIDRKNTKSVKYDYARRMHMPDDVIPLWVADMDFQTSSFVQEALQRQAEHGIYGYSDDEEEYFDAVRGWMSKQHGWEVRPEWLIRTPGVVFALAAAVRAFSKPGDAVMIQSPVYYPFSEVIASNGRRVVSNPLVYGEDRRYHMDFDDLENKIIKENIKLFFLCSPHNPVARVWSVEELVRLGDLCRKYHVTVVSDEIHADFVFQGKHHVFAGIKDEFADSSVICTAPSKTFNLAGLQVSNIFIPNPKLREAFAAQMKATAYEELNVMGLVGCMAAYTHGGEWYRAMHRYIAENIHFVKTYLEEHLPQITMAEHEGTYLVWMDFRALGWSEDELSRLIVQKARLWLDDGKMFGESGAGFQRMNVACPRAVLCEALTRLADAVKER